MTLQDEVSERGKIVFFAILRPTERKGAIKIRVERPAQVCNPCLEELKELCVSPQNGGEEP